MATCLSVSSDELAIVVFAGVAVVAAFDADIAVACLDRVDDSSYLFESKRNMFRIFFSNHSHTHTHNEIAFEEEKIYLLPFRVHFLVRRPTIDSVGQPLTTATITMTVVTLTIAMIAVRSLVTLAILVHFGSCFANAANQIRFCVIASRSIK